MWVLVAGATGVIGRPLVRALHEAGHEVIGTSRSEQRAETIRELGAEALVVDALGTEALRAAVAEARPEVVINQLTNLPDKMNFRRPEKTFGPTNELRGTVGPALGGAAAEAGARRLIAQSVCFFYASTGKRSHSEEDPLLDLPPAVPAGQGVVALESLERSALETPGLEGVVLRYGYFYGPEVEMVPGGFDRGDVRRRRAVIVGKGTGSFSLVHVNDAAAATMAAIDRGAGTYNICDDDPAPQAELL